MHWAAIYSLPTRAWELGVGALLLFIPSDIFKHRILPWFGLKIYLAAISTTVASLVLGVLIVSSFQYYTPRAGYPNRDKWWSDGQRKLLADLKATSTHLIYISDTPHPVGDIPSCLASRESSSCDSAQKSEVKVISGFQVIDPTPWLCTSICPAIKDSIVVYRDGSHISIAMALHLKPNLEAALQATGLFG